MREYIDPSDVSKQEEAPRQYFSFIGYIETDEEGRGVVEKALLYDFHTAEVVYVVKPRGSRTHKVRGRREVL